MGEEITPLFREVLMICDELELIGREMFASDGCKLPSNASKEWSGTKAEKTEKMEWAVRYILKKQREENEPSQPSPLRQKEQRPLETFASA